MSPWCAPRMGTSSSRAYRCTRAFGDRFVLIALRVYACERRMRLAMGIGGGRVRRSIRRFTSTSLLPACDKPCQSPASDIYVRERGKAFARTTTSRLRACEAYTPSGPLSVQGLQMLHTLRSLRWLKLPYVASKGGVSASHLRMCQERRPIHAAANRSASF
eukprot:6203314-Pleurochrysis_carterae.AAC.4